MPWFGPLGQMTRMPVPRKVVDAVSPAVRLNDSVRFRSPPVHGSDASACVHVPWYAIHCEVSSMTGSITRKASMTAYPPLAHLFFSPVHSTLIVCWPYGRGALRKTSWAGDFPGPWRSTDRATTPSTEIFTMPRFSARAE